MVVEATTSRRRSRLPAPLVPLVARWVFLVALTATAFVDTLSTLWGSTRAGGLNGYLWTVPVAAGLAAVGVARRRRTELPIHDRQTDVIVGSLGLGLALITNAVLEPRYTAYFFLVKLDVVSLWLFALSGSILVFGLRPVTRFALPWAMMALAFPFPYHVLVVILGGGRVAAGFASLGIAGIATAIAVGRTPRRAAAGFVGALSVGAAVIGTMVIATPDAPLFAFQSVPMLAAICVSGTAMYVAARRGLPERLFARTLAPLAARQIWSGVPVLVAVAVAIMLTHGPLPVDRRLPVVPDLDIAAPLAAPPGWSAVARESVDSVRRLYGAGATLTRTTLLSAAGRPDWDISSRPRLVVMDVLSTERAETLRVYPPQVLYDVTSLRVSTPRRIDLGSGVEGLLTSAVDDRLVITWDELEWTWSDGRGGAQRVLLIAVDNHEDDAPFPQPTGRLVQTLGTLLTVFFRGNDAVRDLAPKYKDGPMLTELGAGLVATAVGAGGTR